MNISELVKELEIQFNLKWDEYSATALSLDEYRGRELNDQEVEIAAEIVKKTHDIFGEIYPALHWIALNGQRTSNIVQTHAQFQNSLRPSEPTTPPEVEA